VVASNVCETFDGTHVDDGLSAIVVGLSLTDGREWHYNNCAR
jgi:hypothetical protein